MTSISSTGYTQKTSALLDSILNKPTQTNSASSLIGPPPAPLPSFENIDSKLSGLGLSDDQISSFKADLAEVFQNVADSGGTDPETLKSNIDDVFAKYGIDPDQLRPSNSTKSPLTYTPSGDIAKPGEDDILKVLQDMLAGKDKSDDDKKKLSNDLLSILNGVDVEA
jgi:hypothetical protein